MVARTLKLLLAFAILASSSAFYLVPIPQARLAVRSSACVRLRNSAASDQDSNVQQQQSNSDEKCTFEEWKAAFVANGQGKPVNAMPIQDDSSKNSSSSRTFAASSSADVAPVEAKSSSPQSPAAPVNGMQAQSQQQQPAAVGTAAATVNGQQKAVDAAPQPEPPAMDPTSQARRLLSTLRARTSGNGLRYNSQTVDTAEHKAIWAQEAPKILQLLEQVNTISTGDAAEAFAEALMYKTASQGVVSAVLSGSATSWLNAVDSLIAKYPKYDNGVGYIFRGAYHLATPAMMRKPKKAVEFFAKALEVAPTSRRNLYYAGVAALATGDKSRAKEWFKKSLDAKCLSAAEEDVSVFMVQEAKSALQSI